MDYKELFKDLRIQTFKNYWEAYFPRIPRVWVFFSIMVAWVFFCFSTWRRRKNRKEGLGKKQKMPTIVCDISAAITISYTILLFGMLIASRNVGNREINLLPFWSYRSYFSGNLDMLYVNILNMVLFMPLGFFLFIFLTGSHTAGKALFAALLIGFLLSVSVETLQFILSRGMVELDDVIHNTLGTIVGAGIGLALSFIWRRWQKKRTQTPNN